MEFAKKLQELRQKAGMSQAGLANSSGVPVRTIQGWEQGNRQPVSPDFFRLVKALGVSADAFAECDDISGEKAVEQRRHLEEGAKEKIILTKIEPHLDRELSDRRIAEMKEMSKRELQELSRSVAKVSETPDATALVGHALAASRIARKSKK